MGLTPLECQGRTGQNTFWRCPSSEDFSCDPLILEWASTYMINKILFEIRIKSRGIKCKTLECGDNIELRVVTCRCNFKDIFKFSTLSFLSFCIYLSLCLYQSLFSISTSYPHNLYFYSHYYSCAWFFSLSLL